MHTRTFMLGSNEYATVNFNADFSGMASVRWGDVMTGQSVEFPAIVLSVGVADLADALWKMAEDAQKLKDQAADFTWHYTTEDWQAHNKLAPKPLDTRTEFGYNDRDARENATD